MARDRDTILRHLDFSGRSKSEPYTAKGSGGGGFKTFPRRRAEHAAKLSKELEKVELESERLKISKELAELKADAGINLELRGEPGYPLKIESLDSPRFGITLKNVRTESATNPDGEPVETIVATVFVKHGKLSYLTNRVEDYANKKIRTDKKGKLIRADHEDFVANIESIGVAAIEAFWTSKHPLPDLDDDSWWEVWVRVSSAAERSRHESIVAKEAETRGILVKDGKLELPEHSVFLMKAKRRTLASSIALLNVVSELRQPALTAEFFLEQRAFDQQQWADDLKSRATHPPADAPAVCVLDTGVNRGHPLLSDLLAEKDHDTIRADWGKDDHYTNGHGTQMAGLAAFGDLVPLLEDGAQIELSHLLESVKILPRFGSTEPENYGYNTQQAMSIAETNAKRQRVFALAVTASDAPDYLENGKPSAWSAALDSHTSGAMEDDDTKRLVCVSGGNTWIKNRDNYPIQNELASIEDPAQSWNALTVGAFTEKDVVTDHHGDIVPGAMCVAPNGGLSPHSTTSCLWTSKESRHWPLKPEVVFEGGNVAADAEGNREEHDSLCLLSTNSNFQQRLFSPFYATSAATALAAQMAARIQADYPSFWPETIRGLMVHSADGTKEMMSGAKFSKKSDVAHLVRRFGYGVPDIARALGCLRSRTTLICQDSLQPFEKEPSGAVRTRDMMLYRMPWPKELLQSYSETQMKLRVTLSYFIEPNPGSRMVSSKYRYAGCNLRFLTQTATEKSLKNFIARVSSAVSKDDRDEYQKPDDTTDGWLLGDELRRRGSIHSDTWTGTAAQLAAMEHLVIFPVNGWWRLRAQHKKYNNRIRYSLVVTLESTGADIDIFNPIKSAISEIEQVVDV